MCRALQGPVCYSLCCFRDPQQFTLLGQALLAAESFPPLHSQQCLLAALLSGPAGCSVPAGSAWCRMSAVSQQSTCAAASCAPTAVTCREGHWHCCTLSPTQKGEGRWPRLTCCCLPLSESTVCLQSVRRRLSHLGCQHLKMQPEV